MKQMMITMLFLTAGFFGYGQVNHVSMEACGNDTIEYVRINFEENKSQYIGKPMSVLLDVLDFEIKCHYPDIFWEGTPEPALRNKLHGLCIQYLGFYEKIKYKEKRKKYRLITIRFAPPYTIDESVVNRLPDCWHRNKRCYNFYKDFIIQDIVIHKFPEETEAAERRAMEAMKRMEAERKEKAADSSAKSEEKN